MQAFFSNVSGHVVRCATLSSGDIRDREFCSRPRSLVSLGLDLRNLSFHKGQALRKPQDLLPG